MPVNLPPGCGGFTCADGTRYDTRPGTALTLEDRHARDLAKSQYAQAGFITAESFTLGTKKGRWCRPCRRLWQAWSQVCPKCGQPTAPARTLTTRPPAPGVGVPHARRSNGIW